ncbi:hypothetical protein LCGC14_1263890 [marine sediment metagenome]|uniref:Uncharacterized protein n=1 Tax=marine sediment metagenome TaxID=412755 RepID=A0A0F9NGQ6_9ZZZZ
MSKPAKTREELEADGIFLDGKIVPKWFIEQSDAASIKTYLLRFILRAKKAREPAYIHDFDYYLTALEHEEKSPEWIGARMEADARLKDNRAAVAHKHKIMGKIQSELWFRGVRMGGRDSVKDPSELVVPPTLQDIDEIENFLTCPITKQAQKQLELWRILRA